MKRSKVSSKMANVVHSGWMTKSPPERKVNAPFKIFRAQWKKRFFVLRKPSGSLPDQYELHYYKDEHCTSKKGSIDLEQCEQIIESLDSEHFPFLLAIKTIYKNKVRTYYLAVDTETEMTSWVQCLCHVCGLKQEDNPTDIPEPKPAVSQTTAKSNPIVSGFSSNGHVGSVGMSNTPSAVSTSLVINTQPIAAASRSKNEASVSPSSSYIPLDQCVTGSPSKPMERSESTGSAPDFNAPSAPPTYEDTTHEDDVFISGLYHRPPKRCEPVIDDDDTYKVPPIRPHKGPLAGAHTDETDSNKNSLYQVPPPSKHDKRVNSDRTDSVSSSNAPSENYDYPPSYKDADAGIPPERPPRAIHSQSPYQNLNITQGASKEGPGADLNTVLAPPKPHAVGNAHQGYDVPRSSHYVSPPPPIPHRPNQHRGYLNARAANQQLQNDGRGDSAEGREDSDSSNMLSTPAVPPRSGSGSDGPDGRSGSPSAIYHHPPPSSASSSSSSASGAPARPPARVAQRSQHPSAQRNVDGQEKEDGSVIFSTARTRSFKKQHHIVRPGNRANTLPISVPVPAPRPVHDDYSSSDDADDEATHHSLSLLHSVPPPYDTDRELKYIDLDLDHPETTAPEVPRTSTSHSHSHNSHSHHAHGHADRSKDSAIEYREIDFVKTKALLDTKQVKEKEKERKSDDH